MDYVQSILFVSMDILVNSYVHMNVCACMHTGDQNLRECNVSRHLRGCIPDKHCQRCACMRVYVQGAWLFPYWTGTLLTVPVKA